jgi:hypothetical protein
MRPTLPGGTSARARERDDAALPREDGVVG